MCQCLATEELHWVSTYARMICKSGSSILPELMTIQLPWFAMLLYILPYRDLILPEVILVQVNRHHNPYPAINAELAAYSRLTEWLTTVSGWKVMRTDGSKKILIPYSTPQTWSKQDGNVLTHSRTNCCSGKAISITYSECVFVALGILHAMHMPYCRLWHVQLYNIFPHYLINGTIFVKKLLKTKCVLSLSLQFFLKHFSF